VGITVHFEGQLRDELAYKRLVDIATSFASANAWRVTLIDEPRAKLARVRDEKDWDYEGPTKGVHIEPHPSSEPIRLEFDRDLYIQEYTKTQFAPPEIHKALIALLDAVAACFSRLQVLDEAEYYEHRDERELLRHRERFFAVFDENLANDKTLRGPVRLPSGRIVDLMRDQ
jgi:hypothetical protein